MGSEAVAGRQTATDRMIGIAQVDVTRAASAELKPGPSLCGFGRFGRLGANIRSCSHWIAAEDAPPADL